MGGVSEGTSRALRECAEVDVPPVVGAAPARWGVVRATAVTWADHTGAEHTGPPGSDLRELLPGRAIRSISQHRGVTHTTSNYCSSTDRASLACESWLEARWLRLLDHDPDVVAIRTQPLILTGTDVDGQFSHTPDVLARVRGGSARLIDVKNPTVVRHPDVLRRARLASAAAERLGWTYYLLAEPPSTRMRTVGWLSGFRRWLTGQDLFPELLAAAAKPVRLRDLWAPFGEDVQVRPATYHLLWWHRLLMDFDSPLSERTRVWASPLPYRPPHADTDPAFARTMMGV
ncbi:TnsA-like heteromeric transposase endonuclease subunit [Phycicoccus sp. M110.8]|uniref:TnsA-like heteromeric transposase endonuclease subunit n=1 Tax=Phycicoccus sp. M110.8 TaxID=3075433 RepID=UPI0028FD288B|nr:TnsA-like heteromeric transposase endonuclease subunit [Phycicoccus sp. M110.8]MDU0314113.1 TnsA-like heteromeric transposase endonuclease subunit [Phycicoccus sp. M110.8]